MTEAPHRIIQLQEMIRIMTLIWMGRGMAVAVTFVYGYAQLLGQFSVLDPFIAHRRHGIDGAARPIHR